MFARVVLFAATLIAGAMPAAAESLLPDRRAVVTQGHDLPGGDLRSIFDTTLESCERACLADRACVAFTYNARNGSCFPKASAGAPVPYDRAISAVVREATPRSLERAARREAQGTFLPRHLLTRARDQALSLSRLNPAPPYPLSDLHEAARSLEAEGDLSRAIALRAAIAGLTDDHGDWLAFAATAARGDGRDGEGNSMQQVALSAAINAWLRTDDNPAAGRATLALLADQLERGDQGRLSLGALRLAASLGPDPMIEAALDRAASLYGLRIESHRVDADLASPRLCAQFTEDLKDGDFDYSPFVQLSQGMVVEPGEWRELCVAGLSHGQRASVTFREGLPSADGQILPRSMTLTSYIRDRSPEVRFASAGHVLPMGGDAALPIVSVNADEVQLALYAVPDRALLRTMQAEWFGRSLDDWDEDSFTSQVGQRIWQGSARLQGSLNRDSTTRLPMAEALAGRPAGLYALRASPTTGAPSDRVPAWQWFVLSDLGLTSFSGQDGLTVAVRGLSDAAARAGIEVEVLSRSNAVLGRGQTDAEGVARFPAAAMAGTGPMQPALVTATDGSADFVMLSLSDPEFDLSDRGVEGRPAPKAIDLFLATERGAYRPGEVLHATALARDADARALPGLPLSARLRRPDGVEHARQRIQDVDGGFAIAFPIAPSAPRGSWRLDILADPDAPPLASQSFLVEDFLPERIDFTLQSASDTLQADGPWQIDLQARHLFGAPGADLDAEGEIVLREARELAGLAGYRFGRAGEPFHPEVTPLSDAARTDASGHASLAGQMPPATGRGRPLEAEFRIRLAEGSGRPVERRLTLPVTPAGPLIGIRPASEETLAENSEAHFDLVALRPDGDGPLDARWHLDRIETRYQWYRIDGSWNWEPVTSRQRVSEGTITLGRQPVPLSIPLRWGEYELVVTEGTDADPVSSSLRVSAGWYGAADVTRTPDTLELSLDRADYAPGDTARLRLVPRAAGTALVSVLADRVVALKAVEVTEGENIIELPVTDDWGAGVYVTASVLRPMDVAAGRMPARALGLAHAAVSPGDRVLDVDFITPTEARPRQPFEIAVKVAGGRPGETAHVTLAAVDLGILNLTGHKSPDPAAWYFGQRRLGVGIRDLYGRLIDGMDGAEGQVRSGGDGMSAGLTAAPPTEELLAWFQGPVTVDADGMARATMDLPAFNGTMRLMAIAWSDSAIGQSARDVMVRDPVVVAASLPRFLQPGDHSRLLLDITHATGPAGPMGLEVLADGVSLGSAPAEIVLAAGGTTRLSVPVSADLAGLGRIDVRLTTPDGQVLGRSLALPVSANDPVIQRISRIELAPGQSLTLDRSVMADLRPGGHALISTGPLSRFDAAGLMASLASYPWGCSEQLVSRAMPLLAWGPIADAMALPGPDGRPAAMTAAQRVDQTIEQLLLNQTGEGGFGLWSAARSDSMWLDAWVTDFLVRARRMGHQVPERALRAALDNLASQVNYAGDFEHGGEDLAYALMVLASEGAAAVGDLRYNADTRADAFATPLALAQLGAALAAHGDQPRADAMFARASRMALGRSSEGQPRWRNDFGTLLRDRAGVLALARASGSQAIDAPALTERIAAEMGRQPLSTQEQAWILMAAQGLDLTGQGLGLLVDGQPVQGALMRRFDPGAGQVMRISNDGQADVPVLISTFGQAPGAEPAGGAGYTIRRSHHHLDGQPASLDQVAAGTRLAVILEVVPHQDGGGRLMVTDPLPAGFEIDNPNLIRGGQIEALSWIEPPEGLARSEFRQDRFMSAIDRQDGEPFTLAYVVRAVSPGRYHHPAAIVEDMYRPTLRGWTATGAVQVTE